MREVPLLLEERVGSDGRFHSRIWLCIVAADDFPGLVIHILATTAQIVAQCVH